MTVEVPPAWHIFYATGWENATLKCRALHADGTPQASVRTSSHLNLQPRRAVPVRLFTTMRFAPGRHGNAWVMILPLGRCLREGWGWLPPG